ncbi:MAG: hypothetical protein LWW94_11715 [Candidatus Desulfofervidaceae bacterium]|nr:hypothetical protein [Candidatus Desulfofervidaceae bacterium]
MGSSQGKELERPIKPKDFEKGFSEVQAKKGIEELMSKCVNGLMREKQRKIELGDWFISPIHLLSGMITGLVSLQIPM